MYQTNQDVYDDYPDENIKDVSVSSIVARRLSYHFPDLEITSYPYELDNSMHIQIPSTFSMNQGDYIHQVYDSMKNHTNFKKK